MRKPLKVAIEAFQENPLLQERDKQPLVVMLDFSALQQTEHRICAKPELNMIGHIWLKSGNHNHLRRTRTIRSLGLRPCL